MQEDGEEPDRDLYAYCPFQDVGCQELRHLGDLALHVLDCPHRYDRQCSRCGQMVISFQVSEGNRSEYKKWSEWSKLGFSGPFLVQCLYSVRRHWPNKVTMPIFGHFFLRSRLFSFNTLTFTEPFQLYIFWKFFFPFGLLDPHNQTAFLPSQSNLCKPR